MSKVQLQGNVSGTGVFTIASPNSNTDRTLTLPDATGTVQVSGNPISGTTGTFTGLLNISAATAGQIQFPAAQNASSNANTLDDYEEGTWSPVYTNISGVTTSDSRYTKIGRFVLVMLRFSWTGGSGGAISVTLPFTAGAGSGGSSGGCGSIFWQGPNATTFGPISPHTSGNSPTIGLYKLAQNSFTQLSGTDVNGSGYDILCTFSYMVD